ncbi:MAG TPA: peroxiredoxin [Oculatellaceae cyanobacterium]|jgi:peroxiredoxin Q/BCP
MRFWWRYLQPGDRVPDFELPDQTGRLIRLTDCLATGWVLLFFYPKDHTPICHREVCHFRDHWGQFQALGVTVLGVSGDGLASHGGFSAKNALNYPLLSDEGGRVQKAYGVSMMPGFLKGRVTFIIDSEQQIRFAYANLFRVRPHVEKALAFLKRVQNENV